MPTSQIASVSSKRTRISPPSSNDAIVGETLDGLITSCNRSAEELYGYGADEMVGRLFSAFLPQDKRPAHSERLSRIRNGGFLDRFEISSQSKTGREVTVLVTPSPVCNAVGEVVGLSTIAHDISEQKATFERLRLKEERLRLAVEAGHIGLWFLNVSSGKTVWNERCKELFGLPRDEQSPEIRDFLRLVHPDDVLQLTHTLEKAATENKSFNIEYRVMAADGPLRWVQSAGDATTTVDPSGRQNICLHGVAIDFTSRKHTEEELRRTNRDLEQFAYAAAHDLQEPLRNIAISLQLAKATDLTQWSPEAREMLETAVNNSRRMESMVKALLSFSRALDSPAEAIPAVHGNFALRLAMENLKTSITETAARITSDPLPRVAMRQFHLLQIFQNLLSNAMKYRALDPPAIHVSVRDQNSEIVITVQDNGIGIPPQYYDRVFRVFKRLGQTDAPRAGVGLSLCKRIVEHYEGRIWIEPNTDCGVTFAFSVPRIKEK